MTKKIVLLYQEQVMFRTRGGIIGIGSGGNYALAAGKSFTGE